MIKKELIEQEKQRKRDYYNNCLFMQSDEINDLTEDQKKEKIFDIKLTVRKKFHYDDENDKLYSIHRENIPYSELHYLIANLDEISQNIDLKTIVDSELSIEREKEYEDSLKK